MRNTVVNDRLQLGRQIEHWASASERLADLELFSATNSWAGLESYLNLRLRESLQSSVSNLRQEVAQVRKLWLQSDSTLSMNRLRQRIVQLRTRYQRVETLLDFYIDAINTRANPRVAALLMCCDKMAFRSMQAILSPLGQQPPPVLTYIGEGLGAAILKAGLRLWDRNTDSPVAAIKLARHNLYRPTALIHEAGHQVAHLLNWNEELRQTLSENLPPSIATIWASWASEVAADTFAFVHTGYAAVAGLHDVVAGSPRSVFRLNEGDPHPISYLRVLLGIEMCQQSFGPGPWGGMAEAWRHSYPLSALNTNFTSVITESLEALPSIATLCLREPLKAFDDQSLVRLIDPSRVSPEALHDMEEETGRALYLSSHWLEAESLRILALTGYRIAVSPRNTAALVSQQEEWMRRAGANSIGITSHPIRKQVHAL